MIDSNDPRPILVLAPHTDDGEFGCGGAIAKLRSRGARVIYIAFSDARESLPKGWAPDTLRNEVVAATQVLGIDAEDCLVRDFPVRRFSQFRQEILDDMIRLRAQFDPRMVFLPSSHDTHQDHNVVREEGFRAFKRVTMLGYEVPWNNLDFRAGCYVTLSENEVKLKIAALQCYVSQKGRDYANEDVIRSILRMRGVQIGVNSAEAFEVLRWVV
ncbi:MAG: PIG-L family deacetylase [Silvanigrellales bacterium]|jgi:LmbE family N-acetylglucosaminyl deacetylase|nr:PIG-L family deacetylase [Silvanigrellales bacterium]